MSNATTSNATTGSTRNATLGSVLFATFALGFVVATLVQLSGGERDTAHVLAYAASPIPFLVLGAVACRVVQPASYQRLMLLFGVLLLVWMACSAWALATVGGDAGAVVLIHMLCAGAGAVNVLFIRAAARDRGLTI
ncbi:hypothetical protein [Nocardioides sp. Soil805]|uniref:hypothetical protein n=1 Tax=Nocardioides sp. Soil805 TaxID=1736416 RepID=UPI0007036CC1|nr:hypothetical protein [Nocardioides sp. Soil805]KRF34385.1 hypothetical protein ASG94_16955 [Nocardioides sp. Soil805]